MRIYAYVHLHVCVCIYVWVQTHLGNCDRRPEERRHHRRGGGARSRHVKCDAQTRRRRLKRLVEPRKVCVRALSVEAAHGQRQKAERVQRLERVDSQTPGGASRKEGVLQVNIE